MAKRAIVETWLVGWVAIAAGGVVSAVSAGVWLAHVVNATAGSSSRYVPDDFFWTAVAVMIVGGIVAGGGAIVQLMALVGAVFNTHRLVDKTWFNVLLWGGLGGYLLIFVTLGAELAFVFGSSVYAAFVWPGYVVGGMVAWTVTLFYLVAGPDGMAIQQPQMERPTALLKALAPAG
jgi:hypothetical protein